VPPITHDTIGRYCALTNQPEIQDLEAGMDFRLPQYRREVFLRFYQWSLQTRSFPGCVYFLFPYLNDLLNLTNEQKLWLAFLNGNTQNLVTSWLIFKQFPVFSLVDIGELKTWFNQEYKRLEWDSDRRYHKKNFIKATECYSTLTSRKQKDYFKTLVKSQDEKENFREVWKAVHGDFYSFGRLSAFSYLEYLRIQGLPIECDDLLFDDLSGSKSHRNGLSKVLGRDDIDWHKSNPTGFDGKYTKEMFSWFDKEASSLLEEARSRFKGVLTQSRMPTVNFFTLESTFCTYKSWHRPNRRYPGVYADMFHDRIKRAQKLWPELDFTLFWWARKQYLPPYLRLEDNPKDPGLSKSKQNHYRLTGEVIMLDHDWDCFKNSWNKEQDA
jgi:hypothetical protein